MQRHHFAAGSRSYRALGRLARLIVSVLAAIALFLLPADAARADKLSLQDGRIIEGRISRLNTMLRDPGLGPVNPAANGLVLRIDDDLRCTYVPSKFVQHLDQAPVGQRWEEINIDQPVATEGQRISGIGSIASIQPWDVKGPPGFGRRTFSMLGPKGTIDIPQGITKITPVWAKVESLQPAKLASFLLEQRIATTSIPQDVLSKILARNIDSTKIDDRLKVVRLYLQMERYKEAEAELKLVMQDFPGQNGLNDVAHQLRQFRAEQVLREIETRLKAGQYRLAYSLLETFPHEDVDGETLRKVRAKLDELNELIERRQTILKQIDELVAKLKDSNLRERVKPIVKEISDELSAATLDRMATFRRLVGAGQPPESELALAISGWLIGANDATENLQTALSIFEIRNLVQQYLPETDKLRREEIVRAIQSQEAASPKEIAGLVRHLTPYLKTPPQKEPGFYELIVPGSQNEADVPYCIQLPPEYDPHVSYPCVVALNGAGTTPKQMIDFWAGEMVHLPNVTMRNGHAARFGYIVIAPQWTKPHQTAFEGTAREHDAVLSVLRHACRQFAIDTDRVFLSGHSMGGDAAWDIGLAHPDMWAGVIPIVATANKVVEQYSKNAEFVPLYFVCGELDGNKMVTNGVQFERYMTLSNAFDCTVVEFEGRGHEHFSDEILRLFDWMGRKQRNFFPKRFATVTQRPWDNYFWWLELQGFHPKAKNEIQSTITANNGVAVQCGGKITVWLSPEMVDFSKPIDVRQHNKLMVPPRSIQADIATLLEDVRTRGDRRHPFWAKVE